MREHLAFVVASAAATNVAAAYQEHGSLCTELNTRSPRFSTTKWPLPLRTLCLRYGPSQCRGQLPPDRRLILRTPVAGPRRFHSRPLWRSEPAPAPTDSTAELARPFAARPTPLPARW